MFSNFIYLLSEITEGDVSHIPYIEVYIRKLKYIGNFTIYNQILLLF